MTKYYKGYKIAFMLGQRTIHEVVYAQSYFFAVDILKAKYGNDIYNIGSIGEPLPSEENLKAEKFARDNTLKNETDLANNKLENQRKEQIRQQEELSSQHKRNLNAQELKLKELEIKTMNISYKQNSESIISEVNSSVAVIQEWKEEKLLLEEKINSIIDEIRGEIDVFTEYTNEIQEYINGINNNIDTHNNQPNIYNENKINKIDNLDNKLDTKIDFLSDDESLGVIEWIFILIFLALILYGIDWIFNLNIYSNVYDFIKNIY